MYHPSFRSEVSSRACDMAMSDRMSFGNRQVEALTAIALESDTACQVGKGIQSLDHSLSDRFPWHQDTSHTI